MSEAADDLPRDRPPLSQPIEAGFAMAWLYLFWLGTLALTGIGVIGMMVPADDLSGYDLLGLAGVMVVPMVVVILGARVGRRWALRLMRVMGVFVSCVWTGDVVLGLLVSIGRMGTADFPAGSFSAENTGQFVLVASAIIAIPAFLLFRSFRRVRWLDPLSRPLEWEKPMRSAARIRTGRW